MKENCEFLNFINENAKMGVISIKELLNYVKDEDFKKVLKSQLEEYKSICADADKLFVKYRCEEEVLPKMAEIMTYMSVKMLKNKSLSKMAKAMIEGSNKGIIEIEEKLNHYENASPELIKLATKLNKTEQNNLNQLKGYL